MTTRNHSFVSAAIATVSRHADPLLYSLLYFTLTLSLAAEDDILVRPELEAIAKKYPDRFEIYYTLDRPPKGWTQGSGFITAEMIHDHLYSNPKLGAQIQVFMCGPPVMVKKACIPNLEELGFQERDWYVF